MEAGIAAENISWSRYRERSLQIFYEGNKRRFLGRFLSFRGVKTQIFDYKMVKTAAKRTHLIFSNDAENMARQSKSSGCRKP
jgi:hypothetical protein